MKMRSLLACVAVVLAVPMRAAAECGPRPTNACELVNNEDEVFVATAIAVLPADAFTWRVRVTRTYRGTASGEIKVLVFSHGDLMAPTTLVAGQSYLFYTSQDRRNGETIRRTPAACSTWMPLSAVSREELVFLGTLASGVDNARVLGTLVRPLPDFKREPVSGVRVEIVGGAMPRSATTDRDGRFDVGGLSPGIYRVHPILPGGLRAEGKSLFQLAAHACVDAYFETAVDTVISGRVILPLGVKVTGTQVTAFRPDGFDAKSTFADPFGRYTISGLDPGEYVIGINASQFPPRVGAPFPATFAPSTSNRAEARRIQIGGPAQFTGVDITVERLSPIVTIGIKARFADGRPVTEQSLRLSMNGYGEHDRHSATSADGTATVSVIRGVPVYLLGATRDACLSPIRIGPDMYPETIPVTYTPDGCREEFNLSELGMLQTSARGETAPVRFRVTFPDGTPAYKAHIGIGSRQGRRPFTAGFQTDRNGLLELPVPLGTEFTIDADPPDFVGCNRPLVAFNTERGIRWVRQVDRKVWPNWNDVQVQPGGVVVPIQFEGTCKP